jgi:hypothetical protein
MSGSANWVSVLSDCLSELEREQAGSTCPVVDHEIVRGASGAADDFTVWLVCRSQSERREFSDTQLASSASALRRKMIAVGFPENVVDSVQIRATSREEVEKRGGYSFLR